MLMGNFLVVEVRSSHMASKEGESAGRPLGIAHGTVVPENAPSDERPEADDRDG